MLKDFPTPERLEQHPYTAAQLKALRARGEEYLQAGLPTLSYAKFCRYWQDGDRMDYQRDYFERRGHLLVFSLLAKLWPDEPRWHAALEETVFALCGEPLWCVPAHFLCAGDAPLPHEAYERCIDLFAAETAFALAETLALHHATLSPLLQTLLRAQIERRVLLPFCDEAAAQRFETMENNWSGVCGAAVGGAALYVWEDTPRRRALLARCGRTLEVYLGSFGADGICTEGVDYWSYGFGFFVCYADLLRCATRGETDLLADPRAQAIACTQGLFYLGGQATLSFSDGSADSCFRAGLSCKLRARFEAATLPPLACAAPLLRDDCYRYCLAVRDLLWFAPDAPFGAPQPGAWYADAQWLLSRKARSTLAAKGGHNGESHNHNDCGSFVYCLEGAPLLCDLGAGLYDAAYFGPQRYEIFVNRTQSHNAPLPGGHAQCAGAQYAAQVQRVDLTPQADTICLALEGCYPQDAVKSLTRTLCHGADGTLTITDCAVFAAPQVLEETFVSQTPIALEQGRAAFAAQGKRAVLHLPQGWRAEVERADYIGHDGAPQSAYLLHLRSAPAQQVQAALVLKPQ